MITITQAAATANRSLELVASDYPGYGDSIVREDIHGAVVGYLADNGKYGDPRLENAAKVVAIPVGMAAATIYAETAKTGLDVRNPSNDALFSAARAQVQSVVGTFLRTMTCA